MHTESADFCLRMVPRQLTGARRGPNRAALRGERWGSQQQKQALIFLLGFRGCPHHVDQLFHAGAALRVRTLASRRVERV